MIHLRFRFEHIIIADNPKSTGTYTPFFAETEAKHQTRERKVFVLRAEVADVGSVFGVEQDNITVSVVVCAE
jgi:hypothetical protein